jgi:hypothetical protein
MTLPLPYDLISIVSNELYRRDLISHQAVFLHDVLPKLAYLVEKWDGVDQHQRQSTSSFPLRMRLWKWDNSWIYISCLLRPYRPRPSIDEQLTSKISQ